jgi:hypothetical protein
MAVHLYMSLVPEALIASMLSPEEFGVYYAVGSKKKARGRAIFCEIDPDYRNDFFRINEGIARCVPHDDGTPKSSIYISVYRVLEHMDLSAIKKLYLTTQDGRTLGLEPAEAYPGDDDQLHLYQEIAPVHPLVVSTLDPVSLYELIVKNPSSLITVPAIAFAKLRLGELADDPAFGVVGDLPYGNIDHLRECLIELRTKVIHTKMVDRIHSATVPYRTIKRGIFVGNAEKLICFPIPSQDELRTNHYPWWRSANM